VSGLVLHLGVVDAPYADDPGKTTGDVAEILEEKYDVMAGFMLLHGQEVAAALADGLAGSLESLMMGAPPPDDPFAAGTATIGEQFREFIDREELAGLEEGVPTAAALHGVSHRFKRAYVRRQRRPSFVDTGLYRESFLAWVDGDAER
jgi:hypothetical protein